MRCVESDCVGCGLPCRGSACPYHGTYTRCYCDNCGNEVNPEEESLYELEGKEVCLRCYASAKIHDLLNDLWSDGDFMEVLQEWADVDSVHIPRGEDE